MRALYFRCNSGHYFEELYCPFDGWTHPGIAAVIAAVRKLRDSGTDITIDLHREAGVSKEVLRRVVIIEFGDPQAKFEALSPEDEVVDGVLYEEHNVPRQLL